MRTAFPLVSQDLQERMAPHFGPRTLVRMFPLEETVRSLLHPWPLEKLLLPRILAYLNFLEGATSLDPGLKRRTRLLRIRPLQSRRVVVRVSKSSVEIIGIGTLANNRLLNELNVPNVSENQEVPKVQGLLFALEGTPLVSLRAVTKEDPVKIPQLLMPILLKLLVPLLLTSNQVLKTPR